WFGKEAIQPAISLIEQMRETVGHEKLVHKEPTLPENITRRVAEIGLDGVKSACNVAEKLPRYAKMKSVKKDVSAKLEAEFPDQGGDVKKAFEELKYNTMRAQVLDEKRRVDGRDFTTVRPINI